jgi:hypothetical protein
VRPDGNYDDAVSNGGGGLGHRRYGRAGKFACERDADGTTVVGIRAHVKVRGCLGRKNCEAQRS